MNQKPTTTPTTTQSFKATLMQKLLGRNYKWWYIILFYRNSQLSFRANSIFHSLSSIISFLSMLFIWWIGFNVSNNGNYNQILTYFFVLYIYSGLTPMWISEMLGYRIYGGGLTSTMITPSHIYWIGKCEMIGRGFLTASILITTPFVVILPFFWNQLVLPMSIINYLALLSFIPITFSIRYSIDFIMGCSAFWLTINGGLISVYSNVNSILDGTRIPFRFLSTIIPFVAFLPTAYILNWPVSSFQNFSAQAYFQAYEIGLIWCVVMYFLARWVFKMGLKRNEAVGL
jgi:ABC-2 type transport system permease protein